MAESSSALTSALPRVLLRPGGRLVLHSIDSVAGCLKAWGNTVLASDVARRSPTLQWTDSSVQTIQVIDTHTAGHPTRTIAGVPLALRGGTVRERRDDFRARFDHLRARLLHEPRGHAAMVAAVLTDSRDADFGAFFVSSYVYLDMCGHATIGLARTLCAMGQVDPATAPVDFTLETPAGIVDVNVASNARGGFDVSLLNVASFEEIPATTIEVEELGTIELAVAHGGGRFGLVDASRHGWPLERDNVGDMCRIGAAIKSCANRVLEPGIDSVLFFRDLGAHHARHLVVLERNKFDRSPCATGTSARLAHLAARGLLKARERFVAESVLGTRYDCRIETRVQQRSRDAVRVSITGQAYLTAFSTLVVEPSDPLADGFLCS
ncbi:MAG: proline racemase family protein [Gammaproteobacteria bacterium]